MPIRTPNFRRLDPSNSSGEVRAEQTGIGGLVCKAPDPGEPEVDSGRGVVCLLKEDAIASHNGLVEGQARLRALPFDELPDGVIV